MKTISFKTRKPATPDEWVQSASALPEQNSSAAPGPIEPMKRFTIDVPLQLHSRIKIECARRGLKMADVLRDLFEREFPA